MQYIRFGNIAINKSTKSAIPIFSWNMTGFETDLFHPVVDVDVSDLTGWTYDRSMFSALFAIKWTFFLSHPNILEFLIIPNHKKYEQHIVFDSENKTVRSCRYYSDGSLNRLLSFVLYHPSDAIIYPYINSMLNVGETLHSCSVLIHGKVYLFAGISEAGKSTIATLFKEHFAFYPDIGTVINDEKNLISPSNIVCGTPWSGEGGFCSAITGPLRAVFFIQKYDVCGIEDIAAIKAFTMLQQVHYSPYGVLHLMEQSADNLLRLVNSFPPRIFKFTKSLNTPEWFIKNVVERES